MSRKDITNKHIIQAVLEYEKHRNYRLPNIRPGEGFSTEELNAMGVPCEEIETLLFDGILQEITGEPIKVCQRAIERAERDGIIEYGCAVLTKKGNDMLKILRLPNE